MPSAAGMHPDDIRHPEHPPEPLLERFGVHRLHYLVLANHALGRNHIAEIRPRERLAGDIREHDPIAPGKHQLPLERRSRLTHQRGIGLQQPANPERVLLRLLQRIRLPHLAPIDLKRGRKPVHRPDVLQLPVLHLDHQQAAPRMQNQKIRMLGPRADRHVVPTYVVVFEMGFQPPGPPRRHRIHRAYWR